MVATVVEFANTETRIPTQTPAGQRVVCKLLFDRPNSRDAIHAAFDHDFNATLQRHIEGWTPYASTKEPDRNNAIPID
jgi:hypothetical protein